MLMAKFEGSDYDIGCKHGKMFKCEIEKSISDHCRFNVSKTIFNNLYEKIEKSLKRVFPGLTDELKGISDGSGVDYPSIVILNYWEEISGYLNSGNPGLCSSIGFIETAEGPMMGKTTDIEITQRNDYMFQWIYPVEGYKMMFLGKVGTMKCEVGINERGLCLGTSSAMPKYAAEGQIERMALVRQALRYCGSVKETVEFFLKYKFFILGLNIMAMDPSGDTVVIEKGIGNTMVRRTDKKYIFATNFYVLNEMKPYFNETAWYYENAKDRYKNLEKILNNYEGIYNMDFMKRVLRNHETRGGICNHSKDSETFYATILMPRNKFMYLADGRPCETKFKEFHLGIEP